MALNVKIVTFSLDARTIERLEELKGLMHVPNKSRILSLLIEREHRQRTQVEEEEECV